MISNDEYLERIVAGIHAVTTSDADVWWNEKINGRQFDVVVRFRLGTLSYLVVVEVKNRGRPASAADIESFVTKARDNRADKAVFVTAAGYQKGAVEVARRHAIALFSVRLDEGEPLISPQTNFVVQGARGGLQKEAIEFSIGESVLLAAIEDATLFFADGRRHDLPSEATQMTYYTERSHLGDGRTLSELMQSGQMSTPPLGKIRKEVIALPEPVSIVPPDDYYFVAGLLTRVELRVAGRAGRSLSGNAKIEPTTFHSPVIYTNALTGETISYVAAQLPLNTAAVAPGRYYFQLHPLRYFHCAEIEAGTVRWEMIESFQRARLVRSTFWQEASYGAFYIPVSNPGIIQRLRRRLADYRALSTETAAALPTAARLPPPVRPGFRSPPAARGKRAGPRPQRRR